MLRIAYLHRINFEETERRFGKAAKEESVELMMIKYSELRLVDDRIFYGERDLADFDLWYVRSVGTELAWAKLLELYARKHSIRIVDEYLMNQGPLRRFKVVMGWQLLSAGVAYPKTSYVRRVSDLADELAKWEFPVIVKFSVGGRHGMGTFWFRQLSDLTEFENKLKERKKLAKEEGKKVPVFSDFLVQEYIPNDGDYRVMTIGYKCIGGFKRKPKAEKMVMNKSLGKSVGLKKVPEDVAKEAERAAQVLGVEIAGTDLVRHSRTDKVYVVEVNEAPQFKVFERRVGVDVAKIIMKYLKKVSRLGIG